VAAVLSDDYRGDLHTRAQAHAALQRRPVGTFLVRPSETAAGASDTSVCLVVSHVDRLHGIGHMLIYAHADRESGEPVFSNHSAPGAGSTYATVRDVLARYHFPDACRCGWKASVAPPAPVSPRVDEPPPPLEAGIFFRADFRRTDAEAWLASQPPGTYVVRPSKERPDAFTVSLRERPGGLIMHAGLSRASNGTWTVDSSPAVHSSLRQLLLSMPQNLIVAAPLGTGAPVLAAAGAATAATTAAAAVAIAADAPAQPVKPSSATKPRHLARGTTSQQLETQTPPERQLARATSSSSLQPSAPVLRSRPLPSLDDDASAAAAPAVLEPAEPGGYTRPDASRTAAWRAPPQNQYQSLELAPLPYTVLRPED